MSFTLLRATFAALSLSSALALPAAAQDVTVAILDPSDGATVSGSITIAGTSTGLVNGRVAVSIDGGPFATAEGTDDWTFAWDASADGDGAHTITARARECPTCPVATDTIAVVVATGGAAPSVTILEPADGAQAAGTVVVAGVANAVDSVELSVDGGPFQPANGIENWDVVIEDGLLDAGPHTLVARGTAGATVVTDSSTFEFVGVNPGEQTFTYQSSVDGEPMDSVLWIPEGYDPEGPPTALVVHLHGGGGLGVISSTLGEELDARGWIGIAPDGRRWGLSDLGCSWNTSAAYVDHPLDPNVGPGEQDIFDAIDWAVANYSIDPDRIYLTGFSMGGRGTYAIGLKNPDRFAAIAPMAPATDTYEIFVRRPEPCLCKEGMVGGKPGESAFVDTMYSITSARFLIENAFNLPVFHAHGTEDALANNNPAVAPYLHGFHLISDGSFSGDHATEPNYAALNSCLVDPSTLPFVLGFGNTPTLAELEAAHPGAYDWAFMFSPVGHTTDSIWLTGTVPLPDVTGVPDPGAPGDLLGIMDFFAARTLASSPEAVFYKSYTDTHRRSFWVELDITTPWLDLPGAVSARRDGAANALELELVRAAQVTVDLERAELTVGASPLSIELAPLDVTAYDPNLAAPGEANQPLVVLTGDFTALGGVAVTLDGQPLDPELVSLAPDRLSIGPIDVDGPRGLTVVEPAPSAWTDLGFALPGVTGDPQVAGVGDLLPGAPAALELSNAAPSTFGIFIVSIGSAPIPFAGGTLAAAPPVGLPVVFGTDGNGAAALAFDWPVNLLPGTEIAVQAVIFDLAAAQSLALSNALLAVNP